MPNEIPERSRRLVTTREQRRCLRCGVPTLVGAWHHRRGRRGTYEHRHCPCNGVYLCDGPGSCHEAVHRGDQIGARRDGWIVSRHEDVPGVVPVQAYFGGVLLSCAGEYLRFGDLEEGGT